MKEKGIFEESFLLPDAKPDIDFVDVFSPKLVIQLPEYTEINNHAIELLHD